MTNLKNTDALYDDDEAEITPIEIVFNLFCSGVAICFIAAIALAIIADIAFGTFGTFGGYVPAAFNAIIEALSAIHS